MFGSQEVYLRDYLEALRQHHFKIVLAFLLTAGMALVVSFYLPRTYESSTLLEIRSSQRSTPVSTSLFQSVFSSGLNQGEMENLARRFTTESLLVTVVDSLEMEGNPGAKHLPPIGRLRASVQAKIIPDTSYISLNVRLPEKYGGERNAALVANRLVQTLQGWRALEDKQKAASRRLIVDRRLTELQMDLEKKQKDLLIFMKKHGSPATWYPVLSNLLERRKDTIASLRRIRISLATASEEEKLIQERLEQQPQFVKSAETLTQDPTWIRIQNGLWNMEASIADAAARYGEQSPEWRGLQRRREVLKRQAEEYVQRTVSSTTNSVSPLYIDLFQRKWTVENRMMRADKELEATLQEIASLNQELNDLLDALPGQQYDFDLTNRKIEALYSVLLELQKQSIEAEMLLAETDPPEQMVPYQAKGDIVVIDRAYPRKIAVSPDQRFIVVLAILVGLGLGFTWALLSELLMRSGFQDKKRSENKMPKNS